MCRTQYSADPKYAGSTGPPVSVDTTGTAGVPKEARASADRNGSSTGRISGEWKAWLTRSRRVRCPAAAKPAASPSTSCSSPERTTASGPFTAASATRPSYAVSRARTSVSGACTATIAPHSGSACISAALAAISRAASGSVSTPDTWATANSPMECPASTSGTTPQDSSSRNRATCSAKIAGWAYSVRRSRAADGEPSCARSTSYRSWSKWGASAAHTSRSAASNAGKAAASSAPAPGRCDP